MASTSRGRAPASRASIPQLPWDQVRPAPIVLVSGPETVLADRAVRDVDLDHTIDHHGEMSLRMIYVHMIQEYARHNGHADLLREAIDGTTGR